MYKEYTKNCSNKVQLGVRSTSSNVQNEKSIYFYHLKKCFLKKKLINTI